MMKKTLAITTTICCMLSALTAFPMQSSAEADASLVAKNIPFEELTEDELIELKKYYVVLDVPDENGESYYAISHVYTNSYSDLSLPMEFIDENNKPQQGDLIWLENYYDVETIPATIYPFYDGTFNFINFGSAENYLKTQSFDVTFDYATECSTNAYILQDESGTVSYEFPACGKFVPEMTVEFLMYDDKPIYPLSTSNLGDFNTDGDINAMDATRILMAAAAAGAGTEALSAASETAASPIGDVNSDGEVNAMDATIVLVYAARSGAGAQVSVSEVAAELME